MFYEGNPLLTFTISSRKHHFLQSQSTLGRTQMMAMLGNVCFFFSSQKISFGMRKFYQFAVLVMFWFAMGLSIIGGVHGDLVRPLTLMKLCSFKHVFWCFWILFAFLPYGYIMICTWNSKQPFINGCFNWMIPNLYIGNCCFTKHPFIIYNWLFGVPGMYISYIHTFLGKPFATNPGLDTPLSWETIPTKTEGSANDSYLYHSRRCYWHSSLGIKV